MCTIHTELRDAFSHVLQLCPLLFDWCHDTVHLAVQLVHFYGSRINSSSRTQREVEVMIDELRIRCGAQHGINYVPYVVGRFRLMIESGIITGEGTKLESIL